MAASTYKVFDTNFCKEMAEDFEDREPFEPASMRSIGCMKIEWALRTAVAALVTAIYAVLPLVEQAEWNHATVFAPVLAIACVSPSLGATLHHAWQMLVGTIIGCFTSMIVNEILRPLQADLRQILMLVGFLVAVFLLSSRPWALVQKRVSVGVMLCGTVNMATSGHTKCWWYPWTIGTPCVVGLASAVFATMFPWPCLAYKEFNQRVMFQALVERQIMTEQYNGLTHKSQVHVASASQLLEVLRDNCNRLRALLQPMEYELMYRPSILKRMTSLVTFFDAQLSSFRSLQFTIREDPGEVTMTHMTFHEFTDASWRNTLKTLAALVDDVVVATAEDRPVSEQLCQQMKAARHDLQAAEDRARSEVICRQGSMYAKTEYQHDHYAEHLVRAARSVAADILVDTTIAEIESLCDFSEQEKKKQGCSWRRHVCHWFSLPTKLLSIDAFKNTLVFAVLSPTAWAPRFRNTWPEYIWGFIAASFIFSDYKGSSISTGLGRVVGTLIGGMIGLIVMEWADVFLPGKWIALPAYVVVCVLWTFLCSLFRASPRHGYTATVAGFSIYIMVVGKLESFGEKTAQEVVLGRIRAQFIGASVYVLIECLVYPKSAREMVNQHQVDIMSAIRAGMRDALEPYRNHGRVGGDSSEESSDDTAAALESSSIELQRQSSISALRVAREGLQAANEELTVWHKAFPTDSYRRLLHTEEKALRLIDMLHAVVRTVSIEALDPTVPSLVEGYAVAVDNSLKATIGKLDKEFQNNPSQFRRCHVDPYEFLRVHTTEEHDAHHSGNVIGPSAASMQLLDLRAAHIKLRADAEKRFTGVTQNFSPYTQEGSCAVSTMLFYLFSFTSIVVELAERLRFVEAAETLSLDI